MSRIENRQDLAAMVAALSARLAEVEHRAALLEDVNAIQRLHYTYGYWIDKCMYDRVVDLFAEDSETTFLSGVYKGKEGARRLYCTWFGEYFTGGKNAPLDGFLLDHYQMQPVVTVAADRNTAKGRFRGLLLGGPHDTCVKKDELPSQFFEAGVYENEYVREDGVWKIRRLDYVLSWQAEWEKGPGHSVPHLAPAMVCYPENPLGPDYILPKKRTMWPQQHVVPLHYPHPVTGE
jgi:hypothetical protein